MERKRIAVFDTKKYERPYYEAVGDFTFDFFDTRLTSETTSLCQNHTGILCFVNDSLDRACLESLAKRGVRYIGLRCAGFNHVDLKAATELNIRVCRVPGYSPQSVAEFALLQMLCLARKFHRSLNRTKEMNFELDGLVGQALFEKTVGVIGTGQIGRSLIGLLDGFHCQILAFDELPDPQMTKGRSLRYTTLDEIFTRSDFVSLHVPLTPETLHLVDNHRVAQMKEGAFIINTGRGGLVNTKALIDGLKTKKLGGAGLDVYEEEEKYFSRDFSDRGIDDDQLARLMSFPNVLVTSHQAYLTKLSLSQIAATTLDNLRLWRDNKTLSNEVSFT